MESLTSHADLWSVEVRSEVVLDLLATTPPSNNNVNVRRHIFSLPKASVSSWATARKSFEDAINPDLAATTDDSNLLRRVVVVGFGYHLASPCVQEVLVINELQWATYLRTRYDAPRQDQQLGRFHDAVLYVRYADDDDDTKAPPLAENVDTAPLSIPSVQRLQQQQQQSAYGTPTAITAAIGMTPPAVASSVRDDGSARAASVVASTVISQPALQNAPHVVTDRNKPRDAASDFWEVNLSALEIVATPPSLPPPAAIVAIPPSLPPPVDVAMAPLSETNLAALSSGGRGATLPSPLPSIASTTISAKKTSSARRDIGGVDEWEDDDDDDTATVQHQVASRVPAATAAATRRPPSPTLTEQYGFFDRRPPSPGVVRSAFDPFGTTRTQQSFQQTTTTTTASEFRDLVVFTTATGKCYHHESCRYRPVTYMSEADAQRRGLRACMHCGGEPFRRPSQ